MTRVPLDRFLRFPELTDVLHAMADEHPDLLELSEVGRSHEGREIWLCTVTNQATGPSSEKPAIWIDANIHATELTGSTAALHLVDRLVGE
ncbi:MAG: M14 family zinc carboxypeptidase, partial [Acidimicrobiales bacterium]